MTDPAEPLRGIKALLTRWRYRTPECPACRQAVHAADCVLVEVLAIIEKEIG